jgi:hypothetical protein
MRTRVRAASWLLGVGCLAAVVAAGPVGHRFGPHWADVVAWAALVMFCGAVWSVIVTPGGPRLSDSEIAERRVAQAWWGAGRELTRQLVAGVPPPPLTVWGLVLAPGEVAYLEVPVHYSRFCALDPLPVAPGRSVYYFGGQGAGAGSGAMLVAATTSLIVETVELSRARDAAQTRWRRHQHTRAFVTSRQVVILSQGRWLGFSYSRVIGFYPDLEHGQVTLEFTGTCEPVRLQGPAVPWIAALLCWAIHGSTGLRSHPALQSLH